MDSVWTNTDVARYAQERMDSSLWDMEMLAEDVEFGQDSSYRSYLPPALYGLPSPVPAYTIGSVSASIGELNVAGKTVKSWFFGYAHDKYRVAPVDDSLSYYGIYFNLFILTDSIDVGSSMYTISSRNSPHYLATGKQLTSIGPVDFVQMSLASGENFAIINQRYFDLKFGRTVLVVPLKDGSLRFLQLVDSLPSQRTGKGADEWNAKITEEFQERLEKDARVVEFFGQAGVLE